jgi:hypothetical protein
MILSSNYFKVSYILLLNSELRLQWIKSIIERLGIDYQGKVTIEDVKNSN